MNTRYLLTRHLDSTLDLAESGRRILQATEGETGLAGLMVDAETPGLIRLSGTDLHGDILIRSAEAGGRLVAHFRRGDRPVFQGLLGTLGGAWTPARPAKDEPPVPCLLDALQDSPSCTRRRMEIADRALEDAALCGFKDADQLTLFLLQLDLGQIADLLGPDEDEAEPGPEAARGSLTGTARVVLHRGRKVRLNLVEVLAGKTEDVDLEVHYARLPGRSRYLIGALESRV